MNYGINDPSQIDAIDNILKVNLIDNGVKCALLIDTAGNTISKWDDPESNYDTTAFAAIAAGNFATVDSLGKLVGEANFSLLYHKGKKVSIHFSKVSEELLLLIVFSNETSLGLLRLKVNDVIHKVKSICNIQ
jgi:predicted regulator of Ras-like GTPase activity (Roadblock/LC7/MglB family)